MSGSIFSTYSQGENRVTASILAVLSAVSLRRCERLLGSLLSSGSFELVSFENQPSRGGAGVPDAVIRASLNILIETKTQRNAVREDQLKRHLERFDRSRESTKWLLVLTPDSVQPHVIDRFDSEPVAWSSFADLDAAIDELLADPTEVVSEREAFLLRELQAMLGAEGLLGSDRDVLVIPAGDAWDHYLKFDCYMCQDRRTFQPVEYVAFYRKGFIQPRVARIIDIFDSVELGAETDNAWLGSYCQNWLESHPDDLGIRRKILRLSPSDATETITLETAIPNDLKSRSGRGTAFVQSQRYVSSTSIRSARVCSDLTNDPD